MPFIKFIIIDQIYQFEKKKTEDFPEQNVLSTISLNINTFFVQIQTFTNL